MIRSDLVSHLRVPEMTRNEKRGLYIFAPEGKFCKKPSLNALLRLRAPSSHRFCSAIVNNRSIKVYFSNQVGIGSNNDVQEFVQDVTFLTQLMFWRYLGHVFHIRKQGGFP